MNYGVLCLQKAFQERLEVNCVKNIALRTSQQGRLMPSTLPLNVEFPRDGELILFLRKRKSNEKAERD